MFDGAKLKIRWAEKMLGELDGGLKHFAAEQRCEVHSQHNSKTKELRLKLVGNSLPSGPRSFCLPGLAPKRSIRVWITLPVRSST